MTGSRNALPDIICGDDEKMNVSEQSKERSPVRLTLRI
jgi:hypothetical protein